MENTKNSFKAGYVVGKEQEKGSQMMDKAGDTAASAKDSATGAGKVVQDKAQGGVDSAKGAVSKK